jgi:uncharacterized protein (TIGR02145 family)
LHLTQYQNLHYMKVKKATGLGAYFATVLFSVCVIGCDEDEASLPEVATLSSNAITSSSAEIVGSILGDGGAVITESGIVWSINSQPTIEHDKTTDGTSKGVFTSKLNNLSAGTIYFVRTYATNSVGTAYGNEITVTTLSTVPKVSTMQVTSIESTTAVSGGNVTNNGGATLTAVGVCWSTNENPSVTLNTKTKQDPGQGTFESNITGLLPGAKYYVRAYAENEEGVGYGEQVSFTTATVLPQISTAEITNVTSISSTAGGTITSDGGSDGGTPVLARGVCWSTQTAPTIGMSTQTSDGSGSGTFTSSITGLTPGKTYFVRAYATNNVGTSYGQEVSFKAASVLPVVSTAGITDVTNTTAKSGGNVLNDGGAEITSRGICWNTVQNPTIAHNTASSGGGTGSFVTFMTALTPNTTYYVRAFCTNGVGTAYGEELSFTTQQSGVGSTVTDINGNQYGIVTIGTQKWFNQNLKATRYRDGTEIPNVTDNTAWQSATAGAYANFNHSSAMTTHGKLYNFYAVTDPRHLCPTGTHVPTKADWQTLMTYIGGASVAGNKLKESGSANWPSGNTGTDDYNFTLLPSGVRLESGIFYNQGTFTGFWSTEASLFYIYVIATAPDVFEATNAGSQPLGLSVRCIVD